MLIARDTELSLLAGLVDEHPVVTLVGPGGVGKTALARQFAADRPGPEPHFAELVPLGSDDFDEAVAGVLGFPSLATMVRALGERDLVILDNCEHVVAVACDLVATLRVQSPGTRILTTSREPLGVVGERVVPVDPLPFEGEDSPAAQLFVERVVARGLSPPTDAAAVASLCRSLDGLPLAIELAAGTASSVTIYELARHLGVRLDLLSRARSPTGDRHRSLGAAIAWSHQLLDATSRDLFVTLGVFVGPFTLDMAVAASGGDDAVVLGGLRRLVDTSLLLFEPAGGVSWYRMLETVRVFALERLGEEGRLDQVKERVAAHVSAVCDELREPALRLWTADVPTRVVRLFRTVRSTIDWCIAADATPDRSLRLIVPLWWLEDMGHQAEAAETIQRVLDHWPGPLDDLRTMAMAVSATLLRMGDRRDRAVAMAGTVAAEGTGIGVVYAMRILGMEARAAGRFDEALRILADASARARELGYEALALECEVHQSLALARADEMDEARRLAATVCDRSEPFPLLHVQSLLFDVYFNIVDDPDRANRLNATALEMAEADDYGWAMARAYEGEGCLAALRGDTPAAARWLGHALRTFRAIKARYEMYLTLYFVAAVIGAHGDHDLARRALAATYRIVGEPALGPFELRLRERIGHVDVGSGVDSDHPADIGEILAALEDIAGSDDDLDAPRGEVLPRLRPEGDVYEAVFGGTQVMLRRSKGLEDIASLLANPGREIPALDLMGAEVTEAGTGAVLDATARRRYEERVRDLQADIDDAEEMGDSGRAERARLEMDTIVDQLTSAMGLGGRDRVAGEVAEKARSAVTWRIRAAIDRIEPVHPSLADHLRRTIRTGRFCLYDPPEQIEWEL